MKLTNNFTLEEMCYSDTAIKNKLDNMPNKEQIEYLQKLCSRLLQPLRDIMQEPFIISSGFRSTEVNKLVGGVATSQHCKGQASDVKVKDPRRLLAELLGSGLDFDQAILYQDRRNNFLHLSYKSGSNRRQVLYSKGTRP